MNMKFVPKNASQHWLVDALMRDWSTKMVALLLALIVFVVTRDEVTRSYRVPLEVRTDPDRVLLTSLPEEVEVELRGPWTKMASVRANELGSATLDLKRAEPGPLRLDPASIVMPQGVLMSELLYEAVDLRFEDIISRELAVIPQFSGEPHADYERVSVAIEPPAWVVRGPKSAVERLPSLQTEVLPIDGAMETIDRRLSLIPPASDVTFAANREAAVRVKVNIRARRGERQFTVELAAPLKAALDEVAPSYEPVESPRNEGVIVRGAVPAMRALGELDTPFTVLVEIEKLDLPRRRSKTNGSVKAKLRISFSESVPAEVADSLDIEPETLRLDLALMPIVRDKTPE